MKKILALVISVIMIAVLLASCGETPADTSSTKQKATESTQSTAATEATDPAETTNDQPVTDDSGYTKPEGYLDVDFGDRTFKFIYTVDPGSGWGNEEEIWVESREGGTVVDTAVYDRNAIMKKLYHCEIRGYSANEASIANDIMSGTSEYDFQTGEYLQFNANSNDYYVNFFSLDLDMSLPGWNTAYIEQCSTVDHNGVNKLFTFDGDFGISSVEAIWVMFVNLGLFRQNFNDDIFQLVREKKWTIDKLIEYCAAIQQDNGDQIWTVGEDVYGLVSTTHNAYGLITGLGAQFVQKDQNGRLFCDKDKTILADGRNVSAIDKLVELYTLDGVNNDTGYTKVAKTLGEDKALFIGQVFATGVDTTDSELGTAGLQGFEVSFSPLPFPTYQVGDDYRVYVNNKGSSYVISKNACDGNMDIVADFWNVYAYHSAKIVRPAVMMYYGQICCDDENATEMVDIIMNSRVYDYAYYGNVSIYGELHTEMANNGKNNLSKMANKQYRTIQGKIDSLLDSITVHE